MLATRHAPLVTHPAVALDSMVMVFVVSPWAQVSVPDWAMLGDEPDQALGYNNRGG